MCLIQFVAPAFEDLWLPLEMAVSAAWCVRKLPSCPPLLVCLISLERREEGDGMGAEFMLMLILSAAFQGPE